MTTKPTPNNRAIYLSACIIHGQTGAAWDTTVMAGATPQQAWQAWYGGNGTSNTWIEDCDMPCNRNTHACAPYQ
jgi:hypothetical protein